jgi:hypothetical protein
MGELDRRSGRRRALAGLGVGAVLIVLGIVVTTGWWAAGLVGAGLGLCVEAAYLARHGHPLGQRPPAA